MTTREEPYLHLARARRSGYATRGFSRACLIQLIDFPDMPLRTNVHETIKAGGTALLVRTELPLGRRQIPIAYKRVRRRNWWKALTALFRTNRLLKTWRLGRELLEQQIATPRPLAVIVPHWHQWRSEAYLATEWIDGAQNLRQLVLDSAHLSATARLDLAGQAARRVGELLARMHEAHISHRDLKATNLLLRQSAAGVEPFVIDLDGARRHRRRLGWPQRWSNLSRLERSARDLPAVSHTDRLRLLKAYLAASAAPRPDWKTAWRQLGELTNRRAARKRRAA